MFPTPSPRRAVAPFLAQLRVYEPLAAFAPQERERWQRWATEGRAPSPEAGPSLERAEALAAALRPGLPAPAERAYVTEVDGVTLVCPWDSRLRALHALAEARSGLPPALADAAVPEPLARAAEQALAQARTDPSGDRVHVRASRWQVPLPWFVLVDAAEREVRPGAPAPGRASAPAGGERPGTGREAAGPRVGRALLYRTPMSRARRRAARALAVLRRAATDGSATAGVEDLARWLEDFHPRSLVELDYGALVHLVDDRALDEDDSAADVAQALAALGAGSGEQAWAAYARVADRMKVMQGVEGAG